jgi:hemerythrin
MDLADIKPLYIVWSDEQHIQGRPIIDEQHRGVLATINSLNFFLQQGYELNSLMPTIKILVNYLGFHHKTEAGILVATEYPDMLDYDDHTQQTMITLKRVMHQSIDLNDHQLIMKFLRDWWLNHLEHHQLFNPYLSHWDGGYCRVS